MTPTPKVVTLDPTAISVFLDCPQKFIYSVERRLSKKGENRFYLDNGTLFHHLINLWMLGMPLIDVITELKKVKEEGKLALTDEDYEFTRARFLHYTTFWHDDLARPHVVNGKRALEIGFSVKLYENEDYLFILEGRIDRIANQQGLLYILDHKTQSRKSDFSHRKPQFISYVLAAQIQGLDISRLQVDYISTATSVKEIFRRSQMFVYSPRQLAEWKQFLVDRVYFPIAKRDIYKDWGACEGKYWPCQFIDVCEAPPEIDERIIQLNYEQREEWRPWQ